MSIDSLPNEVLSPILSSFSTRALLPWTAVSHRFHALILRILHHRLLVSADLQEYKLILECFHPSSKLVEPHVFCQYLGTDGFGDGDDGKELLYEDIHPTQRLSRLSSLYSKFRPEAMVEERLSGSRLYSRDKPNHLLVTRPINLDEYEDFSQLCIVVALVKVAPQSNLLLSATTVEDEVVRLFRSWLGDEVRRQRKQSQRPDPTNPAGDCQMLWADQGHNVGLKVRVREKRDTNRAFPLLIHRDEAPSVEYELDIEELHVRTTRLLMTMEQALEDEKNYGNTAVVFTTGLG